MISGVGQGQHNFPYGSIGNCLNVVLEKKERALRMHGPKMSARKSIQRGPTRGRSQEIQLRFQDSERCCWTFEALSASVLAPSLTMPGWLA